HISAAEHLKKISELPSTARGIFLAEESDTDPVMITAARIRAMDFSTALPVLMVLLADPGREHQDIVATAAYLESFLVRRMVCGLSTSMYGLFFIDLMNAAHKAKDAANAVAAMLLAEQSGSTRWPDDEEFGDAWRTVPLYRTLRRSRLSMILRALEASLRDP